MDDCFQKALESYTEETPKQFYFYILGFLREKISEKEVDVANSFFNSSEMHVIDLYLQEINGTFLTANDISICLDMSMTEVLEIISRFKNNLHYKYKDMEQIFGIRLKTFQKRKQMSQKLSKDFLSDNDLELIGFYTGQLNYICIDIPELAKKYNSTNSVIEHKIRRIYSLLKNKENLNRLLEKYPDIKDILVVKAKALNISVNSIFSDSQLSIISDNSYDDYISFLKCLVRKKNDGTFYTYSELASSLNISYGYFINKKNMLLAKIEDKEFSQYILNIFPEFFDLLKKRLDTVSKESNQSLNLSVSKKKSLEFLKLLYKKKEDGSYYSSFELAALINMKYSSFFNKKARIRKKLREDSVFYQYVLQEYPQYFELEKQYIESTRKKSANNYAKSLEFLKLLYQKKEDGTYYTFLEIATLLNIKYQSFISKKNNIISKLKDDADFYKYVLEQYPEFFEKEKQYMEYYQAKKTKAKTKKEKQDKSIEFLKHLYKKKEDGTYYSFLELAISLNMGYYQFINKKNQILARLKKDEKFYNCVLEVYPEYFELEKQYVASGSPQLTVKKISSKSIDFLQTLYKKKENGTYYSNSELADLLNMQYSSFIARKSTLLNRLKNNLQFYRYVLEVYPEFFEFQRQYEEYMNVNISKDWEEDAEFLMRIYQPQENEIYLSDSTLAKMLNVSNSFFSFKKKELIKKFETDQEFHDFVLRLYPNFLDVQLKYMDRKIINDVILLKNIYNKQEDGTYLSEEEVSKKLQITEAVLRNRKNKILKRLASDQDYKKKITFYYPDYLQEKEELDCSALKLSDLETALFNALYLEETKRMESLSKIVSSLHIPAYYASYLNKKLILKVRENQYLISKFSNFEMEVAIRQNYSASNSVNLSEKSLQTIKDDSRYCDIPNAPKSTFKNLLLGIHNLENSIYSDYVQLCTTEQKAILALRFGYFNRTSFSVKDIAQMFSVSEEEIQLLTNCCINSITPIPDKNLTKKYN